MKLLFVCTGNTCRSPLAEALCLSLKPGWETRSRGLAAYEGMGASSLAVKAARECGCDLSAHQAVIVAERDMDWADVVYGMTMAHAAMLRTLFPEHDYKVRELPGGDLPDPLGGTLGDYRACAKRLSQDIAQLPLGENGA